MTLALPNYERCDSSPRIDEKFEGVAIAVPDSVDLAAEPRLSLYGVFQITEETAAEIPGETPHRAVVVLLVDASGPQHVSQSFSTAGRAIMLEPAADSPPGMFRGYFNVDAFRMAKTYPKAGSFFLSAYLGDFHSASLSVITEGEPPEKPPVASDAKE